jgi:hypothetical protein
MSDEEQQAIRGRPYQPGQMPSNDDD